MLVKERMSHPVITIHPETPMHESLNLMHKEHIRRLPVVDKRGGYWLRNAIDPFVEYIVDIRESTLE